jgi:hypothetical protein
MKGMDMTSLRDSFLSREHFVRCDPRQEASLVARFGNFTTEALWFGRDLESVSVYTSESPGGITGMSIQRSTKTYSVGVCSAKQNTITLRAPEEILVEVDVWISDLRTLAITVSSTVQMSRALQTHSCS